MTTIEASGGTVHWIERGPIRLRAAHWPSGPRTCLLLHGRTEFMEKYVDTVAALRRRGFAVWSLDWRGQGRSSRLIADPLPNHVGSFQDFDEDLVALLALAGPAPVVALGQSMGAHIALRAMATHPTRFDRAVLVSPMIDFRRPHDLPLAMLRVAAALACAVPGGAARIGPGTTRMPDPNRAFDGNPLNTSPDRFAADLVWLQQDGLAVGGATWGWLRAAAASVAAMRHPAFARRITAPVLMVLAGEERIVDNAAARRLAARLPDARVVEISGARHELLREHDDHQAQLWAAFDTFVAMPCAIPAALHPVEP